jgi:hypothetical protein
VNTTKRGEAVRPTRGRPKASAKRVAELLASVEGKLTNDAFKPTVADFIRLLQIHKEFQKQKPRNIEVTWIDAPVEKPSDAA